MPDIFNVDKVIANVVNQYVVRPTGNSGNTSGINGFVFDVVGDEEVRFDSDITDHYVEDNYAIQDHVALRPVRFSVHGFVGELTDLFPNTFLSILTKAQSLQSIGGFFPAFSAQATQFYAQVAGVVAKAGQVLNQAKNVYSMIMGAGTTATKQQQAYQALSQMWLARQLCSVETPYGILNNMIIETMLVLQRDASNMVSDFEVTFKQINVVSTKTIPSLASINPIGSGRIEPASPTISGVNPPNTPAPITQQTPGPYKVPDVPVAPSSRSSLPSTAPAASTTSVSGRLKTMVPDPVPLGNTIGVPPPPTVTIPRLIPPPLIPLPVPIL
jgi:hypothetical protein